MASTHTSPHTLAALPATMEAINIHDDIKATPVSKDSNAASAASLASITPPDSASGASVLALSTAEPSTSIFVKSQAEDDVFGDTVVPTMPRSDAERVASKIQSTLQEHSTSHANKPAPRADRINSPITPANAQGVLAPEACVFVANLSMHLTDEQLEISCHKAFDVFGQNVTKVRRDRHKHPFALVQFYHESDAARAIEGARDMVMDGRRIRLEHAQARRSVILVKIDGGTPTIEETQELFKNYGPIDKVYPTTNGDASKLGVPRGMWVQFAYYLDYKDAIKFFNSTTEGFRLHIPPDIEPRIQTGTSGSPQFQGFQSQRSSTDQKSVFVGNLPHHTAEGDLHAAFEQFGEIKAINIIHKPINGANGYNVFGFIEFSDIQAAEQAGKQEVDIHGYRIRVEPKEYSARRHSRLQNFSPVATPYGMNQHFNNFGQTFSPGMPARMNHPSHNFYGMSPAPSSHGYSPMHHEMTPYHHGSTYTQIPIYATPPPTNRMRRADFMFNNSPQSNQMFSPTPYYHTGMEPIHEEYENHYMGSI